MDNAQDGLGIERRGKIDLNGEKIKQYITEGKLDKAWELVESYEKVKGLTIEDKLTCQLLKSQILCERSELEDARKIAEQVLKESKKLGKGLQEVDACIEIAKGIVDSLSSIGFAYWNKGELEQALNYSKQSLTLSKEIGYKSGMAWALTVIGLCYYNSGEINLARENLEQSLALYEELGNKFRIAFCLANIGVNYRVQGELDRAILYFQKSLPIFEEIGKKWNYAWFLGRLGDTYRQKGELDLALSHLEQSFEFFEEIDDNWGMGRILFPLITAVLEKGSLDQAEKYLERLEKIKNQVEVKRIDHLYRVAKGMVLKASPRIRDKIRAQELFQGIIEEEITIHELTILAMLNHCELLLDELKTYGEEEVFQEAKTLLQNMYSWSQKESVHSMVVNSLILQARFAIIKGEFKEAMRFLDQAMEIAEEKGLNLLTERVSTEKNQFEDQFETWQNLISTNASMQERINQARIEEYLNEAKKLDYI